jgi:heme-degrading monooxygenase HmoA
MVRGAAEDSHEDLRRNVDQPELFDDTVGCRALRRSRITRMIFRVWRGEATVEDGPRYVDHLERSVFPQLREIEGYEKAYLLRRPIGDRVEFLVITVWQSMDAIRRFAGEEPTTAVVEPEARAVLSDFDETVDHYEVVLDPRI